MFEFTKLCKEFERMSALERGAVIAEKSVKVMAKLKILDVPEIDPVETLATFIVGAVAADGKLDEREYLLIYPALVKAFGDDFDFATVKAVFEADKGVHKEIRDYTADLLTVLNLVDESFRDDVVALCLAVVTVDNKITLKERKYIKKLILA